LRKKKKNERCGRYVPRRYMYDTFLGKRRKEKKKILKRMLVAAL